MKVSIFSLIILFAFSSNIGVFFSINDDESEFLRLHESHCKRISDSYINIIKFAKHLDPERKTIENVLTSQCLNKFGVLTDILDSIITIFYDQEKIIRPEISNHEDSTVINYIDGENIISKVMMISQNKEINDILSSLVDDIHETITPEEIIFERTCGSQTTEFSYSIPTENEKLKMSSSNSKKITEYLDSLCKIEDISQININNERKNIEEVDIGTVETILEITIPCVLVLFSLIICCYYLHGLFCILCISGCCCCCLTVIPDLTQRISRSRNTVDLGDIDDDGKYHRHIEDMNEFMDSDAKKKKKKKKKKKSKKGDAGQINTKKNDLEVGNYRQRVEVLSSKLLDDFGIEDDELFNDSNTSSLSISEFD